MTRESAGACTYPINLWWTILACECIFPSCGIIPYKWPPTPTLNYHMTARSRRNMALFSSGTAHHVSNNSVEKSKRLKLALLLMHDSLFFFLPECFSHVYLTPPFLNIGSALWAGRLGVSPAFPFSHQNCSKLIKLNLCDQRLHESI